MPSVAERKPYVVRFWIEDQMYDYDAALTDDEAVELRATLERKLAPDIYEIAIFSWGGERRVGLKAVLATIATEVNMENEEDEE